MKLFPLLFSAMLTTFGSLALADVTPSTCSQYLNSSDSAFYAAVSSNSSTAVTIAQILDACSNANICEQLSGDNCATTLADRYFISEYFAAVNGNGASGGSFGATAPTSGNTALTNNNANNAPIAPKNKAANKNDSSIHWF